MDELEAKIKRLREDIGILHDVKAGVQAMIDDRIQTIWEAEKESRKGTPDEAA